MITLADLAALHQAYADDLAATVEPVVLDGPRGPVTIGDGPVTLMGCINLSRDSTYRESVATSPADAVRMGRIQAAQGAALGLVAYATYDLTSLAVIEDFPAEMVVPDIAWGTFVTAASAAAATAIVKAVTRD